MTSPAQADQRRPGGALTLTGVVLGAAMFGFTAAGLWYQFCLDQGEPDAAAAFADLAPPPELILLASLGLIVTVAMQSQALLRQGQAREAAPHPTVTMKVADTAEPLGQCA